jgi:hypothetical protein
VIAEAEPFDYAQDRPFDRLRTSAHDEARRPLCTQSNVRAAKKKGTKSLVPFAVSGPYLHLGKDNLFFALQLVQNAVGDDLQMGLVLDKIQIVGRHRQHGTQVEVIDPLGV